MADTTPPDHPDKVGPGNPPKRYRWKKGCPSPNPRGRPPSRTREDMLRELDHDAALIVKISDQSVGGNGMTLRELAIHRIAAIMIAPSGEVKESDRLAAHRAFMAYDAAARSTLSKEKEKRFHSAMDYKERWTDLFRKSEREGRPQPKPLPHPDDIIIHADASVEIVGPLTPAQQAAMEEVLKHRNNIAASFPEGAELPAGSEATVRALRRMWNKYNKALPPRLKLPFPNITVAAS